MLARRPAQQQQSWSSNSSSMSHPCWSRLTQVPAAPSATASGGLAALAVKHLLGAMSSNSSSSSSGSTQEADLHVPTVLAAECGASRACLLLQPVLRPLLWPFSRPLPLLLVLPLTSAWSAVPLQLFLPWVAQLLARLGDPGGAVLVAPLRELAARYCLCPRTCCMYTYMLHVYIHVACIHTCCMYTYMLHVYIHVACIHTWHV